jgi:hypothetical protein
MPPGRDQSVGSIGSHTTNTRIGDWVCSSICWIAEAPRRQYAQVGDSSSTKRVRSAALLNSCLKWSRLLGASDVRGGWPCGVRLQPQKYQKTKDARATDKSTDFRFTPMTSASYHARNDLRKQNNQKNYRGSDPE